MCDPPSPLWVPYLPLPIMAFWGLAPVLGLLWGALVGFSSWGVVLTYWGLLLMGQLQYPGARLPLSM